MNEDFLVGLVAYIVDTVASETGSSPLFTKVVKLLYLIDVEYYRALGRPLTGLRWRFHHFGPWDDAIRVTLQGRLRGIAPVEADTAAGKGSTWEVTDRVDAEAQFRRHCDQAVVNRVLSKWGPMETDLVLEHVYEDTEPMQDAHFGELLDFGKVNRDLWPDRPARFLGAERRAVQRISEHVAALPSRMPFPKYLLDPDYLGALPALREDITTTHVTDATVRVPREAVDTQPNQLD